MLPQDGSLDSDAEMNLLLQAIEYIRGNQNFNQKI